MNAYDSARRDALIKQLRGIQGFKIDKKKITELTEDEVDKLTLKQLEEAKVEWDEREKRKEEAAITNAFRKSDYLERARREEFVSVLKKEWENRLRVRRRSLIRFTRRTLTRCSSSRTRSKMPRNSE